MVTDFSRLELQLMLELACRTAYRKDGVSLSYCIDLSLPHYDLVIASYLKEFEAQIATEDHRND
jgi:hypothetical protein